jgi:very-short-patch-repair endonuclease
MLPYNKNLNQFARILRKNMTDAVMEKIWKEL